MECNHCWHRELRGHGEYAKEFLPVETYHSGSKATGKLICCWCCVSKAEEKL